MLLFCLTIVPQTSLHEKEKLKIVSGFVIIAILWRWIMTRVELKRKLRALKLEEIRIRNIDPDIKPLIFSSYFSLKSEGVQFPFESLLSLNHDARKEIFELYFFHVYATYYRENYIPMNALYNPDILNKLGLPVNASKDQVKMKFRELVKLHHPDKGGDPARFRQIMDLFDQL